MSNGTYWDEAYLFSDELGRLCDESTYSTRRLLSVAFLTRGKDLPDLIGELKGNSKALYWLYKATEDRSILPLLNTPEKHALLIDDFSL